MSCTLTERVSLALLRQMLVAPAFGGRGEQAGCMDVT